MHRPYRDTAPPILPLLPHTAIYTCAALSMLCAYRFDAHWLLGYVAMQAMLQLGRQRTSCLPAAAKRLWQKLRSASAFANRRDAMRGL